MDADKPRYRIGRETLLKVLEKFVKDECFTIMRTKGKDYESRGDPFEGLKQNAARSGVSPEVALFVLMNKHLDAIGTYIRKGHLHSEPIEERIADAVNHLLLLYGYYVSEGRLPMPDDVMARAKTLTDEEEDALHP